jgi:hypothetical protein
MLLYHLKEKKIRIDKKKREKIFDLPS